MVSNSGIKLVSLALALLLEFYFYSQDNSTTQLISAVLEFQNVPNNRLIIDPPSAEGGLPAHIEVNGPKSIVQQISQGFHVVKVPFPDKAPFTFPIDIKYESLQLPPSVRIVSAKPARLTIRTVELLRKEVPIVIPTEGTLPEGFELGALKIFPKTVIARGPLQEIQKLESITLEPLNLTGLGDSSRFELRVKPPSDLTSLNINIVSVEIDIKEKSIKKEFNSVEITQDSGILGLGSKVAFTPAVVKVILSGPKSVLDQAESSLKIIPEDSIKALPGKVKLKALVDEKIIVEKIIPNEVTVKAAE